MAKKQANSFTWVDLLLRFLAPLALVLLTYNPSGFSFYTWFSDAIAAGTVGGIHFLALVLIVIGADTIIVQDGRIFGKPKDMKEARRMLKRLSAKPQMLYTGIAVIRKAQDKLKVKVDCEKTRIYMDRLTAIDLTVAMQIGDVFPVGVDGHPLQLEGGVLRSDAGHVSRRFRPPYTGPSSAARGVPRRVQPRARRPGRRGRSR